MDRTHVLAALAAPQSALTRRDGPAALSEIDAFYEAHGHDVFSRFYRLRWAVSALFARRRQAPERKRDFVPGLSSR